MLITILKSKLHRATVTDANLDYEGSIAIDQKLCEAARLLPYERVEIYNLNNGMRFATYVIYGDNNQICLNGAAARCAQKGDLIIIASYMQLDEVRARVHSPAILLLNKLNGIKRNSAQ